MPKTGKQPIKWHGGKCYLAQQIIALMPRHAHYVEPFAGGLAVLLARDPADESLWLPPHKGVSEVANDKNLLLTSFWRTLASDDGFERFFTRINCTPLSRIEFDAAAAMLDSDDPTDRAVAFFVRCRQSMSGRMKSFTPITRNRLRRKMNGNVSEWLGAIDGLPAVHDRLRHVLVEGVDAVRLIKKHDGPGTLFYCDPPYLHETRTAKKVYDYEMTREQHVQLLDALTRCEGSVMLSGYPSELYDTMLAGWERHTFDIANHAANGKSKGRETEVLWIKRAVLS